MSALENLPGGDLIRAGLRDAAVGIESVESLLVEIAASRLRESGLQVPAMRPAVLDAEIRLHRLLAKTHGDDAHGRYNALLRRIVSFTRALDATAATRRNRTLP